VCFPCQCASFNMPPIQESGNGFGRFNTKSVNHVYSQGVASIQSSYLRSISCVDMPASKERGMQRPSGAHEKTGNALCYRNSKITAVRAGRSKLMFWPLSVMVEAGTTCGVAP
jgi:hypothetical protein